MLVDYQYYCTCMTLLFDNVVCCLATQISKAISRSVGGRSDHEVARVGRPQQTTKYCGKAAQDASSHAAFPQSSYLHII